MSIAENLDIIKKQLPANVKLVAVSKYHPEEDIMEAYNAGQRVFGESRMQELVPKYKSLPKDIEWHFIGHLQTNKVKDIVPCVHTIHSVDSLKLLNQIESRASMIERHVNCLIEVHVAKEDSKYGFTIEKCKEFFAQLEWKKCIFVKIVGLMGMATDTDDAELIASEFDKLKVLFDEIKTEYFSDNSDFCELSMGMSHDYKIAVEKGSTMIRLGTSIFGERAY